MESFWRSETPLLQEFTPEKPVLRENEIALMVDALKPALSGRKAGNLLIYGRPGTGKTTISKYVARKFAEQTGRSIPVYANCWQSATENSIVSRIAKALQLPILTSGIKTELILDEVFTELKKNKRELLLILDEADQLISRKEEGILYEFSRSGELRGVGCALLLITNRREEFSFLDDRVKSSLSLREVEFKPYTPTQLKAILTERARLAFKEGSCGEEVIAVCAARGAKEGGDCRKAIECLWLSAKEAEKKGLDYISTDCIPKKVETKEKEEITENLTEGEKTVINFIAGEKDWVRVKKIYDLMDDRTERSARRVIEKLTEYGLLETRQVKEGRVHYTELKIREKK